MGKLTDFGKKVPTKADLAKDKRKHLVVTKDADPLGDALDEFHKVAGSGKTMAEFARPIDQFLRALKAFEGKYKTKHPKFIATLNTEYEKPIRKVLGEMEDLGKSLPLLIKRFKEAEGFLDKTLVAFRKPPSAQSFKETLGALSTFGSLLNNSVLDLRILGKALDYEDLVELRESYTKKGINKIKEDFDRALQMGLKTQDFKIDQAHYVKSLVVIAKYIGETEKELDRMIA